MSLILKEARTLFLKFRPILVCPLKIAQASILLSTLAACSINCQANLRYLFWDHTLITRE